MRKDCTRGARGHVIAPESAAFIQVSIAAGLRGYGETQRALGISKERGAEGRSLWGESPALEQRG